jgi:hypothetical protein
LSPLLYFKVSPLFVNCGFTSVCQLWISPLHFCFCVSVCLLRISPLFTHSSFSQGFASVCQLWISLLHLCYNIQKTRNYARGQGTRTTNDIYCTWEKFIYAGVDLQGIGEGRRW